MRSATSSIAVLTLIAAAPVLAQDATFEVIPRPAGFLFWRADAVSRDGRVIAGRATRADGGVLFIWRAGSGGSGTLAVFPDADVPDGVPLGVSNDGNTLLLKDAADADGHVWRAGQGWTTLIDDEGDSYLQVFDLSADGQKVVGWSRSHAAYWPAGSASPVMLPEFVSPACSSLVRIVSGDGSLMAGSSRLAPCGGSPNASHAALWDNGGIQSLGTLPGDFGSDLTALSANGQHGGGWSRTSDFEYRNFIWSAGAGMTDIGPDPDPEQGERWPVDVSNDGRTALLRRLQDTGGESFYVWTPGQIVETRDHVEDRTGEDLSDWSALYGLRLAEGGAMIGHGSRDGQWAIWRMSNACIGDFNGDGETTVADFSDFRAAYLSGDLRADFSGDGSLSVADFTAFRAAYLAGCP